MQLLIAGVNDHITEKLKWPEIQMESWLSVEWETTPEGWMYNAALAFDAALHNSNAPDDTDLTDKTVVYIKVFKESERPAHHKGVSLPPPGDGYYEVIANPMVKKVAAQPLLWSKIGQWLNARDLLTAALAGVVTTLVGIFLVDPGASKFKVADTVSYNNELVDVLKPHTFVLLSHVILFASALFFVFHKISGDLLKLAAGFDAAVIAGSCAMCEGVLLHEIIMNYRVAKVHLPFIDILFYASRSVLTIVAHFSVSVMDAWTFNVWGKMGVLIPFILCLSTFYLRQRFMMSWSKRQTCAFGECTTWQGVYLSALKNEIIFGIKLLLPYLKGRSYAVLNFRAIDPERELYKRQRQSQRNSRMSKQSRQSYVSSVFRDTCVSTNGHNGCNMLPDEGIPSDCVPGKAMEQILEELNEAKRLDFISDEESLDNEPLHQKPRSDSCIPRAFTGSYFESSMAEFRQYNAYEEKTE